MKATASPGQRSYWCFISYRHADNKEPGRQWTTWLHQAIETCEAPEDLVGKVKMLEPLQPSPPWPLHLEMMLKTKPIPPQLSLSLTV